jgi:uncharacterized protein YecE (DUF72 family)
VLWVGTSGWQYRHWRATFYPEKLAQARWLDHYTERFRTVEVNNTFYHLPEASTFEKWRERTPGDFVLAVKMSRFLTHLKRLRDPEEPVERFMTRAEKLGDKLGPVLLQMPPQMEAEPERLAETLELIPRGVRVAAEFRHPSWFTHQVFEILSEHGAALCLADSPRRKTPQVRTADWGFVRFHEGRATPRPCYGEQALGTWVEKLAELFGPDRDVYAYFNNDWRACAIRDAIVFAHLAKKAGLKPTRVPAPNDVTVAL